MPGIIQLLPDHVANQIAAGEVVQRPASVVKELLENAIDAKATDIKLIVKDAGKTLIQVIDNGIGMSVTDARMCFERHATSKIKNAEDLFALNTKGFRGEALASIAAIAHIELKTKKEQDELGTHSIIEGSKFISQEPAVVAKGTSFSVKNLFFNIPARRNFLKSNTVEMRHIIDEFQRVALAHPSIYFTLIHNGSELFNLPASNYRQRIVNMLGGKTNEKLVPITETTEIVAITGFVGKPEFAKKTRSEQFFFVNNRFIKNGYLHHAVTSAFDGLLKEKYQPSYFLFLNVPPHTIDINIHPTKTEIKFDDEQSLYAILRAAVKHGLGQFNIAPILDFNRNPDLDTPYTYKNKPTVPPTIEVDASFNPFKQEKTGHHSFKNTSFNHKNKDTNASWNSLYTNLKNDTEEAENTITFESKPTDTSLFANNTEEINTPKIYQIKKKYICSAMQSGLLIMNQNKAHQRILYEEYLSNITVNNGSSQQLLFPLQLHFSTTETQLIKEWQPTLQSIGFVFSTIDKEEIKITGIPINIQESQVSIVLDELLSNLHNEILENSFSLNDAIAKTMAKSLAIKNGTIITTEEQENLVNSLFACKEPKLSPFNKTTFVILSTDEIDKKFTL